MILGARHSGDVLKKKRLHSRIVRGNSKVTDAKTSGEETVHHTCRKTRWAKAREQQTSGQSYKKVIGKKR